MARRTVRFPDDSSAAGHDVTVIPLAAAGARAPVSKAHKTFSRLVAKIEAQREQLAQWQDFLPRYQQQIEQLLVPLDTRIDEQYAAMLALFDRAHDNPATTRRERGKLAALICQIARERLERSPSPHVLALHDKYSDLDYETLRQQEVDMLRALAADLHGGDRPDAAWSGAGGLERGHESESDPEPDWSRPPPASEPPKPGSGRASKARARQLALAEGATRAVRDVYRKLVSALHPDRESDPHERDRKTELMQRVNHAYDRKDLLQLLSLQIDIEQIDAAHLHSASPVRIAHYIAVLKDQSHELEQELEALTSPLAAQLTDRPMRPGALTPDAVMTGLRVDAAALRHASAQIERDLAAFRDIRYLKAWLKQQRAD